jgi:acyl-coenzyme A thioesterase PaaI-like protein
VAGGLGRRSGHRRHRRRGGHGAVGGLAIRAADKDGFTVATLDLRIDYMRPAAPRAGVIAEAHCYKVTRTAVFVRAHAWDVDPDDPIATAQTVFVRSKPGKRA